MVFTKNRASITHSDFLRSSLDTTGRGVSSDEVITWIRQRNGEIGVEVNPIPLASMAKWKTEADTGNLVHESGKFFSIEGVSVKTSMGEVKAWSQPIIHQPEVGILGLLARKIDGVYHFLIQAKIEPGNVNCVQLSPTLQATRSNFTRAHQGKAPHFLDYFQNEAHRALVDLLQSEQGARFFRKRNRNMIIEVNDSVPDHEDFRWLTLGQIKKLMEQPNLVNMDTRTVLSGVAYGSLSEQAANSLKVLAPFAMDGFGEAVFLSHVVDDQALHRHEEIMSWLVGLKATYDVQSNLIPLAQVEGWTRDEMRIRHEEGKYFEVIGVDVAITNREVSRWCQPLIKPVQEGICALVAKKIDGALHFLLQAKLEAGNLDIVELAPTVQCITGNYRPGKNEYQVPYLDYVLQATPSQIRHDVLLSEEGGRFFHSQNRYMVIEAGANFPDQLPDNYCWMTLNQIMRFMYFNNFLNIEVRSLISMLSLTS